MKSLDHDKVQVNYHWEPFQLAPHLGQSITKEEHYDRKFGRARYLKIFERLQSAGAKVGCEFNMGGRIGNSFQSHRLIEWSKKFGFEKHNEVLEQIFIAYFKDNKDISDKSVLADCATAAGVEGAEEFLVGTALTDEVKSKLTYRGVNGVPYFIVNKSTRFSGAHPVEVFKALFEELGCAFKDGDDESN